MFEIDRQKFGAFVSELRKEKGYTQKDLAEKLYISDKAISKWETGVSIYPVINFCMSCFLPDIWMYVELYVFLVLLLGGLFIPIYVVAKKHEYI